ncbi:MAG TPA: PKD domain-containing protein [Leadbetterella sp.]|nr:PKD domain-containing protein [Leadbetterella sp.]
MIKKLFLFSHFIVVFFISCQNQIETTPDSEPIADFGFRLNPTGSVNFQNLSKNSLNYKWDFGDSTTSSNVDPEIEYFLNGNYSVEFIAENKFGKTNKKTKVIEVNNSNAIFDKKEVRDFYSKTNGNEIQQRGRIEFNINGLSGTIYPSQLPVYYDYTKRYLFLSYWYLRDKNNDFFSFNPEGFILSNKKESFVNAKIQFRSLGLQSVDKKGSLVEIQGKWIISKLSQNRLTGSYIGVFELNTVQKVSYNVSFKFYDIYVPFVVENPL